MLMKPKYKIGYTTGVYDMFHVGHLRLIKRAKEMCEHLIVGVSTDELVQSYKNKAPIVPYEERKEIVAACRYVDEVVPLYSQEDKYQYLEKADIFACGEEYKNHFDRKTVDGGTYENFSKRKPL